MDQRFKSKGLHGERELCLVYVQQRAWGELRLSIHCVKYSDNQQQAMHVCLPSI